MSNNKEQDDKNLEIHLNAQVENNDKTLKYTEINEKNETPEVRDDQEWFHNEQSDNQNDSINLPNPNMNLSLANTACESIKSSRNRLKCINDSNNNNNLNKTQYKSKQIVYERIRPRYLSSIYESPSMIAQKERQIERRKELERKNNLKSNERKKDMIKSINEKKKRENQEKEEYIKRNLEQHEFIKEFDKNIRSVIKDNKKISIKK